MASDAARYILVLDLEDVPFPHRLQTMKLLEAYLRQYNPKPADRFALYEMQTGAKTDDFLTAEALADILAASATNLESQFQGEHEIYLANKLRNEKTEYRRPIQRTANLDDLNDRFLTCLTNHLAGGDKRFVTPEKEMEFLQCIQAELDLFNDESELKLQRTLAQLHSLVGAFPQKSGLKVMLFISPGFAFRPGRGAEKLARGYAEMVNEQGIIMGRPPSMEKAFHQVIHACLRHRVKFHTLNIFDGISHTTSNPHPKSFGTDFIGTLIRDYRDSLETGALALAEESGGIAFKSSELQSILDKAIQRSRVIYVIGYNSPGGKKGKFREIKVKARPKAIQLHHRQGYFVH